MLIYEIVNNEYKVESKTVLWAQLNQSVCFFRNRLRGELFLKIFSFVLKGRESKSRSSQRYQKSSPLRSQKRSETFTQKRSPLSYGFSLFIWESETFVFLFWLSWWPCQSLWLLVSSVSPFYCVVLSLGWAAWHLTLNWLVALPW